MESKRLIHTLRIKNLLSFGDEGEQIDLQPLNVLIGPNASGKSNLIEVFRLLRAAPGALANPIRDGGGISEWLWKGGAPNPVAEIDTTVAYSQGFDLLRYHLCFRMVSQRLEIVSEAIDVGDHKTIDGSGISVGGERSILSQRKDPVHHPEITYLGEVFSKIGIYPEWNLGIYGLVRKPQGADLPTDALREDALNLGLILNNLPHNARQPIVEQLKQVYDAVEDIHPKVEGGTVQIYLHERGLPQPISALRLSEGTLRYLCWLTLLNQPVLPPLLCLEEPEVGLHPDVIRTIAELLIKASERTQIIVTTHSDILVSALSEVPESIIVCERDEGGSHLRRLEPEQWKPWLEKYALGDLWRRGDLGGTRW
jgi:predicted ATPase